MSDDDPWHYDHSEGSTHIWILDYATDIHIMCTYSPKDNWQWYIRERDKPIYRVDGVSPLQPIGPFDSFDGAKAAYMLIVSARGEKLWTMSG